MSTDSASAYLRTKVLTASPEELRMMLFDGALRFIRQGRDGLVNKDFESSFTGFTKCRNIIIELMNVKADVDPQLKSRIQSLYTFMYVHLTEGSFEKDLTKIDKVIELLAYERETWALAMDAAAKERAGQSPTAAAPVNQPIAIAPTTPAAQPVSTPKLATGTYGPGPTTFERRPLSLQG